MNCRDRFHTWGTGPRWLGATGRQCWVWEVMWTVQDESAQSRVLQDVTGLCNLPCPVCSILHNVSLCLLCPYVSAYIVTFSNWLSLDFLPHICISLINPVCFCSSYINFVSYPPLMLNLSLPSSIFPASRNYPWLSKPCLLTLPISRNYFHNTLQLHDFWKVPRNVLHLPMFKIPGLQQKASAVHELKPLSRTPSYLETTEAWSTYQVA